MWMIFMTENIVFLDIINIKAQLILKNELYIKKKTLFEPFLLGTVF